MTDVERATQVLRWGHSLNVIRYNRIRQANPDAPEQEILALWTEETYRDSVPADRLAHLCQMIRDDVRQPE